MKSKIITVMLACVLGAGAALVQSLVSPSVVSAHGGGLDRYGCHKDNKAGNYHCHRGPCAGKTFGSQGEMLTAPCAKGK